MGPAAAIASPTAAAAAPTAAKVLAAVPVAHCWPVAVRVLSAALHRCWFKPPSLCDPTERCSCCCVPQMLWHLPSVLCPCHPLSRFSRQKVSICPMPVLYLCQTLGLA